VSKDDDQLQAALQMVHGIFHAAKHLGAKTVSRHAYDEKIIWPFAEDEFDGDARIRASENCSERMLMGPCRLARQET
jgi:hypothetical protein